MSRYILIRRLRGPALLLLLGVMDLLAQTHVLRWEQSWPLFLIALGVFLLAERVALAAEGYSLFPRGPCQGAPNQPFGQVPGQNARQTTSTSIVPSPKHDFDHYFDSDSGRGER